MFDVSNYGFYMAIVCLKPAFIFSFWISPTHTHKHKHTSGWIPCSSQTQKQNKYVLKFYSVFSLSAGWCCSSSIPESKACAAIRCSEAWVAWSWSQNSRIERQTSIIWWYVDWSQPTMESGLAWNLFLWIHSLLFVPVYVWGPFLISVLMCAAHSWLMIWYYLAYELEEVKISYRSWVMQTILEVFLCNFVLSWAIGFSVFNVTILPLGWTIILIYLLPFILVHCHIVHWHEISLGSIPSCPAEEMFLCRLLKIDSIQSNGNDGIARYVEESLASRHSSTLELMKFLEDTIDAQRAKTESIAQSLNGMLSTEGQRNSWCEVQLLIHHSAYLFPILG